MVLVTMMLVGVVDVAAPFHQLAVSANLVGSEMVEDLLPFLHMIRVYAQDIGRRYGIEQNLPRYGMAIGCPFVDTAVLRRCAWGSGIGAVGFLPEIILGEQGCPFDQRVAFLAQPVDVAGVIVVIPHLRGEPRAAMGLRLYCMA